MGDLLLDRVTHWYHASREWIKKAVILDGVYVFNNPWSLQSMEKHTAYCAMIRLGVPVPETWLVPPKEYEPKPDLKPTLERYARMFDLDEVGLVATRLFMLGHTARAQVSKIDGVNLGTAPEFGDSDHNWAVYTTR